MTLPVAWVATGCQQKDAISLEGQIFPNLVISDLHGVRRQINDFIGSALILNVWATWCGPCREEMAGLQSLFRALRPRGLSLVGISVDEDLNLVKEYVRYARIDFPIWSDPRGDVIFNVLPSRALPSTLLIDRSGRVRRFLVGAREWRDGDARKWTEELLV